MLCMYKHSSAALVCELSILHVSAMMPRLLARAGHPAVAASPMYIYFLMSGVLRPVTCAVCKSAKAAARRCILLAVLRV